MLVKTACIFY